jgi:hypothetical protein
MNVPEESQAFTRLCHLLSHHDIAPALWHSADWEAIITLAEAHSLLPMVAWCLRQRGWDKLFSPPLQARLQHHTRQAVIRYALFQRAQNRIQAAFDAAGIACIWLKGMAVSTSVYPLPELRPMADIDVWVQPHQRREALRMVESLGFHLVTDDEQQYLAMDAAMQEQLSHHYLLVGGDGPVTLELHYALLGGNETILTAEASDWFWSQQVTDARGYKQFTPEAHLLHLSAHQLLQHQLLEFRLQHTYDLHLIVQPGKVDWKRVLHQAGVLQWEAVVGTALGLAQRWFGSPVPDTVMQALSSVRNDDPYRMYLETMQQAGGSWARTVHTLRRMQPDLRRKVIYAALLPTRHYMRQRYRIPDHHPTWVYYPVRWFRQGKLAGHWLWQRLTRR